MPITVIESADPFTSDPVTGETNLKEAKVAKSQAYHRLCRELVRYATGKVSGRSFLIAGHRGAGKTTVVLKAIEDTQAKFVSGPARPIPVRLNGPDLLPRFERDDSDRGSPKSGGIELNARSADSNPFPAANNSSNSIPSASVNNEQVNRMPLELLKGVTRAIYLAAGEEFAICYRKRILELDNKNQRDLLELAA
jgi:hypothetical protein